MDGIKIISSDDHVFEPPDLWTSRLGDKYGDRTPHVARLEDGYDWWVSGDRSMLPMSSGGTQPGVRQDAPDRQGLKTCSRTSVSGDIFPMSG